jgi:hypothetical protein
MAAMREALAVHRPGATPDEARVVAELGALQAPVNAAAGSVRWRASALATQGREVVKSRDKAGFLRPESIALTAPSNLARCVERARSAHLSQPPLRMILQRGAPLPTSTVRSEPHMKLIHKFPLFFNGKSPNSLR